MPTYRGGDDSLDAVLGRNIKVPSTDCHEGTIFITFIVEADGSVSNIRIFRGFTGGHGELFNEEALRVVGLLTDWIPGQCDGKNVPVQHIQAIKFRLSSNK